MDKIYGHHFFKTDCGEDYRKKDVWKPFFSNIAQRIIDEFNPTIVLDAGCAMGYLVEALREKGVEAYGFDISEYAISNVDEKAKPFCFVHSITEKLPDSMPQKFDLIITIEVLEHLFPEDGEKAIKNLCQYSDTIVFTSTPTDIENMTHLNVQQSEYWCKEFAKNSFFRDHVIPVNFICNWAMLFRKKSEFENVIFDYELYDRIEKVKYGKLLNEKDLLLKKELNEKELKYKSLLNEYNVLSEKNDKLEEDFDKLEMRFNEISSAFWWRITKPARVFFNILKRNRVTSNISKLIKSFLKDGVKVTLIKIKNHKVRKYKNFVPSKKELDLQRKTVFKNNVKFSVLVPLYNTPKKFLKEMINSVIDQTYSNWELCLADGSDSKHSYVEGIVKKYAEKDGRIKYKKLKENKGISENTNACIEMATGDYIALFDHDDLLYPSALFENVKAINEKNADFLYSDEDIVKNNLKKPLGFHFKPDFAIDNLRANNYICHFTVVKKRLLDETGLFKKEFDGSQDHDLILRLVEKAKNIVHIPRVLYHWRAAPNSVANDISKKPYAVDAGINSVKAHLRRCGLDAEVESSKVCQTIYRIKYKIIGNPLVSILIPNKDHVDELSRCINSVLKKSSYKNIEIIVIENNSVNQATFDYYKELESYNSVRVITYKSNGKFNYSSINNFGASFAKGEHLLFLNNDTEVINENWIEELLMYSQREDVGAVGAKLYYPNDTIQHGGVILGLGGIAGCPHLFFEKASPGYMGRLGYANNLSAVTAACMMVRKEVFNEVNGFDENFAVAYNDIDLCMKIRKLGYLIVWTPFAELYHYESISRGYESTKKKKERFESEKILFKKKWSTELKNGDPYYNPNLTLNRSDFSMK